MKWRYLVLVILVLAGCTLISKSEITSKDIPLKEGTRYETFSNDVTNNTSVPVSFRLKGPWDFSHGPTALTIKSVIMKGSKAPNSDQFPKAVWAENISASAITEGLQVYNFTNINSKALFLFGQSMTLEYPEFKFRKYDKPERLLVFPLKIGMKWVDDFKMKENISTEIRVERKVLSKGTVKVPAGIFRDCFLVQIKRTAKRSNTISNQIIYVWWATDVGPVAWIVGQPDDTSETFEHALSFSRLKSFYIPE